LEEICVGGKIVLTWILKNGVLEYDLQISTVT